MDLDETLHMVHLDELHIIMYAHYDLDEGTCHERLRRIIHMGLRDVVSRSRRVIYT